MSSQRDPEMILAAWLDEGPLDLPDVTRRAILAALATTPQARRGPFAPRRFLQMSVLARAAIGLAAALVVVGGLSLLGGVGAPARSPSPSPATTPRQLVSPLPEPSFDDRAYFRSSVYDYFIEYPGEWGFHAATLPWTKTVSSASDTPWWGDPALDTLQGSDIRLVAWGQPIPQGETADQWVRNVGIGETVCQADSQLPASFPVGQSQGRTVINGCPSNGGLLKDGVVYEVAVPYNGYGWVFTFDGRVDAPYVLRILNSVVFLFHDAGASTIPS